MFSRRQADPKLASSFGSVKVACKQCIGCRLERKRQWAVRIMHEAQMTPIDRGCCFITLTYDDKHLPADRSLNVEHWQNFAKKFRRDLGKFRFYHAGEYGEDPGDGSSDGRPHYHAAVFGHDFRDSRELYKHNKYGDPLFVSPELSEVWGKGFAVIADLTFESAAYIASYVMKKRTGDGQEEEPYVNSNGEPIRPPYATMSRNPGIGKGWFEAHKKDLNKDFITTGTGKRYFVPKYYDGLQDTAFLEEQKRKRKARAMKHAWNNTPERLRVREEIAWLRQQRAERTL